MNVNVRRGSGPDQDRIEFNDMAMAGKQMLLHMKYYGCVRFREFP